MAQAATNMLALSAICIRRGDKVWPLDAPRARAPSRMRDRLSIAKSAGRQFTRRSRPSTSGNRNGMPEVQGGRIWRTDRRHAASTYMRRICSFACLAVDASKRIQLSSRRKPLDALAVCRIGLRSMHALNPLRLFAVAFRVRLDEWRQHFEQSLFLVRRHKRGRSTIASASFSLSWVLAPG